MRWAGASICNCTAARLTGGNSAKREFGAISPSSSARRQEGLQNSLSGFTMAHDSSRQVRSNFLYEQEDVIRDGAEETGKRGGKSDEECACPVFALSRGSRDPAYEWTNIFRMQRGKRLLRNDKLRRANCNLFRGRRTGSED